jgi:hypothetical protein
MNFVRLPIYAPDLEDAYIKSTIYAWIDTVVQHCANRGIYVLLDLHGAPGGQNKYLHSGRLGYNKLFEEENGQYTQTALDYQTRTINVWKELATRYKNNPTVMGYDLLNEPDGRSTPEKLWDYYDKLYKSVLAIDNKHIVMMECTWDWATLPNPSTMNWTNVVYQFHYYCPGEYCDSKASIADQIQGHKNFINSKVEMEKQYAFDVPVMVGEFNAYNFKEAWDYYLKTFNQEGWSWAIWSYKVSYPNSTWGILTDQSFNPADVMKVESDPFATLLDKFNRYDTLSRHVFNVTLTNKIKQYLP